MRLSRRSRELAALAVVLLAAAAFLWEGSPYGFIEPLERSALEAAIARLEERGPSAPPEPASADKAAFDAQIETWARGRAVPGALERQRAAETLAALRKSGIEPARECLEVADLLARSVIEAPGDSAHDLRTLQLAHSVLEERWGAAAPPPRGRPAEAPASPPPVEPFVEEYREALAWDARGDRAKATGMLESLTARRPRSARFRAGLGAVLIRDGKLERAEAELRRAIELEPSFLEAYLSLGFLQERLGRPEPARETYARGLASGGASDPLLPVLKDARDRLSRPR